MKLQTYPILFSNHETITRCVLSNGQLTVSLLSYGACIENIRMQEANPKSLTLTLNQPADYQNNSLYAGATLGPNAGRISHGILPMGSKTIQLSQNDGAHQLHGGYHNLAFCNWAIKDTKVTDTTCSILFSCQVSDGVDGYPGNRRFTVCYTLNADNTLSMQYHADTDCPTYVNLSNHTYFNLGKPTESVYHHRLQIDASSYTVLQNDHIPLRVDKCTDTPFDFSAPCSMAEQAKKYPHHPGLAVGRGYNHGFLLNNASDFPDCSSPQLTLTDPVSGSCLEVFTDAPCIVVYSGGFIGDEVMLEGAIPSFDSCGVAIECQDVPDTPNLLPGQMKLTTPEKPFERRISFHFRQL